MRIQFGAGNLFLNPNGGNTPTLKTPQFLATLQDVNIEIAASIKELRGQFQFPDDTAISDRKITWKTGFGRFDIDAYNNLYFGETAITTGGNDLNVQEADTIPTTAPYTVTVTNSATFTQDLGVVYAATGQKLTKVLSLTDTGQYTVSGGGTYTFYPTDAGLGVLTSYVSTVTTGRQLTVNNHNQGFGPALELFLSMPYQELTAGVPNYCHLYSCKISKLGQPFKRADYLITDIEGEAYSNAAGKVADFFED